MTRFQKVFCVFLCLCFFAVLAILPEPFSMWKIMENVYRQFPFYYFIEEKVQETWIEIDEETSNTLTQANGGDIGKNSQKTEQNKIKEASWEFRQNAVKEASKESGQNAVQEASQESGQNAEQDAFQKSAQNNTQESSVPITKTVNAIPHPTLDLSADNLSDYDFLLQNFYIVDENTDASAVNLNAANFLAEDFSIKKESENPQILIYHSHSQETFADSREGRQEDTIVGVGDYLAQILTEQYGYQVVHITEAFDMMSGELDRNKAYEYSCNYIENILKGNSSIEVVIDLHRDGIDENRRLVTEINGKSTAKILFYNGLSYTNTQGKVSYLPNPYIQDNLAFSFQLEYQAALYYPDFYRGIYLAGLRYNLHLKKRALLLEAGAQTNTVQEVKNAMEPFADILNRVLQGNK